MAAFRPPARDDVSTPARSLTEHEPYERHGALPTLWRWCISGRTPYGLKACAFQRTGGPNRSPRVRIVTPPQGQPAVRPGCPLADSPGTASLPPKASRSRAPASLWEANEAEYKGAAGGGDKFAPGSSRDGEGRVSKQFYGSVRKTAVERINRCTIINATGTHFSTA